MTEFFFLLLFLAILIERVTEKILYLFPRGRRLASWIVSIGLSLAVTLFFRIGLLELMGFTAQGRSPQILDRILTGILIASGSEPIHSLFKVLDYKKEEIKRKAKILKDA